MYAKLGEQAVLHDYFFIVGAQKNLIFAFRRAFWNHTTMQGSSKA